MTDVQLKEPILRLTRLQPYPCQSCLKVFYASAGLEAHHRTTHAAAIVALPEPSSKAHICGFCGKSFTTRRWMNNHVGVQHMGSKPIRPKHKPLKAVTKRAGNFACKFCGDSFTTKRWMNNHVKRHLEDSTHVEGPHKCTHCKYGAPTWSLLWRHVRRSHRSGVLSQPASCKLCPYTTTLQSLLTKHMVTHNGVQSWKCTVCNDEFALRATLAQHMVTHGVVKPVQGSVCGKQFVATADAITTHMLSHSNEPFGFGCISCGRIFANQVGLRVHAKHMGHAMIKQDSRSRSTEDVGPASSQGLDVHIGVISVDCSTCGKVFSGQEHLEAHMVSHSQKPFSCLDCGRKFNCSKNLTSHQMAAHRKAKRFECSPCGKTFSRKQTLKQHIKATHSEDTPFECSTCAKQFTTKFSLDRHLTAAHSESKIWECSSCGQEFTTQRLLDGHNIINHNGMGSDDLKPDMSSYDVHTDDVKPDMCPTETDVHTDMCSDDVKPDMCPTETDVHTDMCSDDVKPDMCPTETDVHTDMCSDDVKPDMCPTDVHTDMCSENVEPEMFSIDVKSKISSDDVKPVILSSFEVKPELADDLCDNVTPEITSVDVKPYMCSDSNVVQPELSPAGPIVSGLRCPLCCHQFAVRTRLTKHLRGHCEDSTFRCDTCNCAFRTQLILNSHIGFNHSQTILGL